MAYPSECYCVHLEYANADTSMLLLSVAHERHYSYKTYPTLARKRSSPVIARNTAGFVLRMTLSTISTQRTD